MNPTIGALRAVALPDAVRVEVLARFLGLVPDDLHKEIVEGRLPARLVAGQWLVSRRAVLTWLEGTQARPGEQR